MFRWLRERAKSVVYHPVLTLVGHAKLTSCTPISTPIDV